MPSLQKLWRTWRANMLLLDKNARILGQGITGDEGSRAALWAKEYGTHIVAGVRPGKGGEEVHGIPIFDTVLQAIEAIGGVDGSVQFVPPLRAKEAAFEALNAGLKFHLIVAEKVPAKDSCEILALARQKGASVIGPNTVGLINPSRKLKVGLMGGENPDKVFVPGKVAVISKSGSMAAEISLQLKRAELGISWAIGIGGDRIIGTDFVDFLLELEQDPETRLSVIFGELGGTYEERVAKFVKAGKIKKPIVAYIAGDFTQKLPSDVQFGHAGAIIEGGKGMPDYKRKVLADAGVVVAWEFDMISELVKQ